jgi:hypothetical protein
VGSPPGGCGSAISVPPVVIVGVVKGLEEQPGPTPLDEKLQVERVIEFTSEHLVCSFPFPFTLSLLSLFKSGGDAAPVLTAAYRLPDARVEMRSGVTVTSTRGSIFQRARYSSTSSGAL